LKNSPDATSAILPGLKHRSWFAHHRISGSSKSTFPSNPYTCTCFSLGSVNR
jgi:hypothetical protein